jgi:hypothetical protein
MKLPNFSRATVITAATSIWFTYYSINFIAAKKGGGRETDIEAVMP